MSDTLEPAQARHGQDVEKQAAAMSCNIQQGFPGKYQAAASSFPSPPSHPSSSLTMLILQAKMKNENEDARIMACALANSAPEVSPRSDQT